VAEVSDQPSGNPHQWRFRISIRALVLFVLIVGSGLGWVVRRARIQRNAVAAIREAGGSYWYDWEYKEGTSTRYWTGEPWAPRWLVQLVGPDFFGDVVAVDHYGSPIESRTFSDQDLLQIGRLTGLIELRLWHSSVSDAGLACLDRLTSLERIRFFDSKVTDAGLAHFKNLPRLKELCLFQSAVTDAGLLHLKGLSSLQEVDLGGTKITDAGLASLEGLANLRDLNISGTQVTDAGLVHLKKLARLKILRLGEAWVSDGGVKELQQAMPGVRIQR
jgi:hypothetical protein